MIHMHAHSFPEAYLAEDQSSQSDPLIGARAASLSKAENFIRVFFLGHPVAKFVLGEAVQHPDGLAVIGIFFSVTPK